MFRRNAQRAFKAGEIDEDAFQRISRTIQALQRHAGIEEMVGTGVVSGANPKLPSKRTFNMWGAPGSTGKSIEGYPIGTKEDRGEKKKSKKKRKKKK